MAISAYDKERLCHINSKMDFIYDHADEVYELLVDRDFEKLKKVLDDLIEELDDIRSLIVDDI